MDVEIYRKSAWIVSMNGLQTPVWYFKRLPIISMS